jgi:isochorismate hydrolase
MKPFETLTERTTTKLPTAIPEAALREATIRKDRAALLVVDMQEYFREISRPILHNLRKLMSACRDEQIPLIYTQHGYTDPQKEAGMLNEWWGDAIVKGTPAWKWILETAPHEEDMIIPKTRYSAFYQTELEGHLRLLGIEDLLIAGVMTNLCCETTARDGFMRDFRIFFLTDGTATVLDDYHTATLRNLAYGFAYLKTCEDCIEDMIRPD